MHIMNSSFYEYHDLAYKYLKLVVLVIFMLSRAARQQKVPRAQV